MGSTTATGHPAGPSYLQPDAAGDGKGVAVLVVQLDVADEHVVHTHGVTGRQGIQLGLQRERAGHHEGRRPRCNRELVPRRRGATTSFGGNWAEPAVP